MQDQNYIELEKGDLVIVSKYKIPHRAVIEDISENSVSLLMFHFNKIPENPGWEWDRILKKKPELIKNGYYFKTMRCSFNDVSICVDILRVDWKFTSQELEFYNTTDPSTLIKPPKKYSSVTVKSFLTGKTNWMRSNLDVTQFNNGDPIPLITDKKEWKKCAQEGLPACCYYNNDKNEFGTRGLLYNVHAINDPRGIFPKGWRLPKEADYRDLIELYGGQYTAGKRLRHQKGWYDGPFMTMSDFEGLPNGTRRIDGEFEGEGYYGQWLMGQEDGTYSHLILRGDDIDALIFPVTNHGNAYSVRGVKPKPETKIPPVKEGAITDLKNTKIKINNLAREVYIFQEYAFRNGAEWSDGPKKKRFEKGVVYLFIDKNLQLSALWSATDDTYFQKDKRKEIFYDDIFVKKMSV